MRAPPLTKVLITIDHKIDNQIGDSLKVFPRSIARDGHLIELGWRNRHNNNHNNNSNIALRHAVKSFENRQKMASYSEYRYYNIMKHCKLDPPWMTLCINIRGIRMTSINSTGLFETSKVSFMTYPAKYQRNIRTVDTNEEFFPPCLSQSFQRQNIALGYLVHYLSYEYQRQIAHYLIKLQRQIAYYWINRHALKASQVTLSVQPKAYVWFKLLVPHKFLWFKSLVRFESHCFQSSKSSILLLLPSRFKSIWLHPLQAQASSTLLSIQAPSISIQLSPSDRSTIINPSDSLRFKFNSYPPSVQEVSSISSSQASTKSSSLVPQCVKSSSCLVKHIRFKCNSSKLVVWFKSSTRFKSYCFKSLVHSKSFCYAWCYSKSSARSYCVWSESLVRFKSYCFKPSRLSVPSLHYHYQDQILEGRAKLAKLLAPSSPVAYPTAFPLCLEGNVAEALQKFQCTTACCTQTAPVNFIHTLPEIDHILLFDHDLDTLQGRYLQSAMTSPLLIVQFNPILHEQLFKQGSTVKQGIRSRSPTPPGRNKSGNTSNSTSNSPFLYFPQQGRNVSGNASRLQSKSIGPHTIRLLVAYQALHRTNSGQQYPLFKPCRGTAALACSLPMMSSSIYYCDKYSFCVRGDNPRKGRLYQSRNGYPLHRESCIESATLWKTAAVLESTFQSGIHLNINPRTSNECFSKSQHDDQHCLEYQAIDPVKSKRPSVHHYRFHNRLERINELWHPGIASKSNNPSLHCKSWMSYHVSFRAFVATSHSFARTSATGTTSAIIQGSNSTHVQGSNTVQRINVSTLEPVIDSTIRTTAFGIPRREAAVHGPIEFLLLLWIRNPVELPSMERTSWLNNSAACANNGDQQCPLSRPLLLCHSNCTKQEQLVEQGSYIWCPSRKARNVPGNMNKDHRFSSRSTIDSAPIEYWFNWNEPYSIVAWYPQEESLDFSLLQCNSRSMIKLQQCLNHQCPQQWIQSLLPKICKKQKLRQDVPVLVPLGSRTGPRRHGLIAQQQVARPGSILDTLQGRNQQRAMTSTSPLRVQFSPTLSINIQLRPVILRYEVWSPVPNSGRHESGKSNIVVVKRWSQSDLPAALVNSSIHVQQGRPNWPGTTTTNQGEQQASLHRAATTDMTKPLQGRNTQNMQLINATDQLSPKLSTPAQRGRLIQGSPNQVCARGQQRNPDHLPTTSVNKDQTPRQVHLPCALSEPPWCLHRLVKSSGTGSTAAITVPTGVGKPGSQSGTATTTAMAVPTNVGKQGSQSDSTSPMQLTLPEPPWSPMHAPMNPMWSKVNQRRHPGTTSSTASVRRTTAILDLTSLFRYSSSIHVQQGRPNCLGIVTANLGGQPTHALASSPGTFSFILVQHGSSNRPTLVNAGTPKQDTAPGKQGNQSVSAPAPSNCTASATETGNPLNGILFLKFAAPREAKPSSACLSSMAHKGIIPVTVHKGANLSTGTISATHKGANLSTGAPIKVKTSFSSVSTKSMPSSAASLGLLSIAITDPIWFVPTSCHPIWFVSISCPLCFLTFVVCQLLTALGWFSDTSMVQQESNFAFASTEPLCSWPTDLVKQGSHVWSPIALPNGSTPDSLPKSSVPIKVTANPAPKLSWVSTSGNAIALVKQGSANVIVSVKQGSQSTVVPALPMGLPITPAHGPVSSAFKEASHSTSGRQANSNGDSSASTVSLFNSFHRAPAPPWSLPQIANSPVLSNEAPVPTLGAGTKEASALSPSKGGMVDVNTTAVSNEGPCVQVPRAAVQPALLMAQPLLALIRNPTSSAILSVALAGCASSATAPVSKGALPALSNGAHAVAFKGSASRGASTVTTGSLFNASDKVQSPDPPQCAFYTGSIASLCLSAIDSWKASADSLTSAAALPFMATFTDPMSHFNASSATRSASLSKDSTFNRIPSAHGSFLAKSTDATVVHDPAFQGASPNECIVEHTASPLVAASKGASNDSQASAAAAASKMVRALVTSAGQDPMNASKEAPCTSVPVQAGSASASTATLDPQRTSTSAASFSNLSPGYYTSAFRDPPVPSAAKPSTDAKSSPSPSVAPSPPGCLIAGQLSQLNSSVPLACHPHH